MNKVIGIDLGTSSIKATLAYINGEIIVSESINYPLLMIKENWAEQNPLDWYHSLVTVLHNLNKKSSLDTVEGVSFSGQMHGLVILDDNDEVIRPAILWNDGRTVNEVTEINKIKNLMEYTGNIALTGFTAPKILWIKYNEPKNFKKIKKIMLPKDYLAYKMSGVFASDVTDNSGTLYFDVKNKKWSEEMLKFLGINEEFLPTIYASSDVIGTISPEFAKISGLSVNTKVIIGGGDQAIGAIGTGTIDNNQVSISLGTSGVVFASSENYIFEKEHRLHSFCHANGKYHVMGVTLSSAASMKWWVENILKMTDYKQLIEEIEVDNINNLIFLPYLMGERSPINDPHAKSIFYNLSLIHERKDITKAIIEGIAFSLYDCLKVIYSMNINPKYARVIGGLTKSEKILQVLADILGLELRTINVTEGASLGAVIMAINGCYPEKELKDICNSTIHEDKVFIPNQNNHKKYNAKFSTYKKIYKLEKSI